MTIIIIIIIYHLSFVFLFWTDGRIDGWMGSTYLITGRKHTSTNLKVLAWVFFFILFDMVWVRYAGYGIGTVWLWVWYMVLALGRTKDIRHGTRMKYIHHEEGEGGRGGDGRMLKVHTYIPTSF